MNSSPSACGAGAITAARAASRLSDPRFSQVFDAGDAGELGYVVMEWVVGESLLDMLADGPLIPCAVLLPRLGSAATAGEGTQNPLCAYLAITVFAGLAANTLLGAWWLDGVVALGIAGWSVIEGRRAWTGKSCGCACQPGEHCLPLW